MWIIFDLDDTLIDTSGSVTPLKLREGFEFLLRMGAPIPKGERAFLELLALNEKASRSKEALVQFAERYLCPPPLLEQALELLSTPLPPSFAIPTTPFAKEILEDFRALCPLALVTGGPKEFQMEKLEKAGLDSSIFSKIAIPEDSVKKPHYEALVREFSLLPGEVWVCGDRVSMDLLPAHELGLKTIRMLWGRGAKAPQEPWIDYTIATLKELKGIIRCH